MKGLILAGGTGSRLYPSTVSTNKHLLPVYDKPLIYYPLSTLIMAGCREIAIISNEHQLDSFHQVLGSGEQLGINLTYLPQAKADGIVGALKSASNYIENDNALVVLGDNIFFGGGIGNTFKKLDESENASIWVKRVHNPSEYGVITVDSNGEPIQIDEKPKNPKSNLAVTGLYYFPKLFIQNLSKIELSQRSEFEITSLIEIFLKENKLDIKYLSRGTAWFDAGTPDRLFMAADYVRILQERSGEIIGSPEEVSLRIKMIPIEQYEKIVREMPGSNYRDSLMDVELLTKEN